MTHTTNVHPNVWSLKGLWIEKGYFTPLFIKMHCIAIFFVVDTCLARIQKDRSVHWLLGLPVRRPIIHLFIHSFLKNFWVSNHALWGPILNNVHRWRPKPCPEGSVHHVQHPLLTSLVKSGLWEATRRFPALSVFSGPSLLPHTTKKTQQSLKNNPVNCSIQFCLKFNVSPYIFASSPHFFQYYKTYHCLVTFAYYPIHGLPLPHRIHSL